MIDVAEGRRLKAAAEKAWEEYLDPAETPVASTPEAFEKAGVAEHDWGEWLANNLYALLDAAERAEAAERELSEAREGLQAGLAALTPFAHKDLCKALGGNAEGDASRIFVRNSAVITLGDCRRARAIVVASETAEWGE